MERDNREQREDYRISRKDQNQDLNKRIISNKREDEPEPKKINVINGFILKSKQINESYLQIWQISPQSNSQASLNYS